jgi:hypothetical protein
MASTTDDAQKERQKELLAFIRDNFSKQKEFANEYGLSESQVSGWLSEKSDAPPVPTYIPKLIDLTRKNKELSAEIQQLKAERIITLEPGYAVVRFSDAASPGTILCRGIPDIHTAKHLASALHCGSKEMSETSIKDS